MTDNSSAKTGSIVLVGPMGAGKTSIGRRVAKALGMTFVDTDAAVVRDHGPIEAIFAEAGEARFRELEHEAVRAAIEGGGVVALGGGAVLDPRTRAALAEHRVVLLTLAAKNVPARIRGSNRPLLQGEDPVARWSEIFEQRRRLYDEVADVTFDTSEGPLQLIVDAIVAWAQGDPVASAGADEEETP
ncbi:shikimate kinase [Microbacterium sp. BWT-B31]